MDAQIARVGFMSPSDTRGYLATLLKGGLTAMNALGAFEDLVVIDQTHGPSAPCDWIDFLQLPFETGRISLARFRGNTEQQLVCPPGWSYEKSLFTTGEFHPGVEPDENYEFLRTQDGLDVYRDRRDGREVFVGRTS
jgi:hypothetical protein